MIFIIIFYKSKAFEARVCVVLVMITEWLQMITFLLEILKYIYVFTVVCHTTHFVRAQKFSGTYQLFEMTRTANNKMSINFVVKYLKFMPILIFL